MGATVPIKAVEIATGLGLGALAVAATAELGGIAGRAIFGEAERTKADRAAEAYASGAAASRMPRPKAAAKP